MDGLTSSRLVWGMDGTETETGRGPEVVDTDLDDSACMMEESSGGRRLIYVNIVLES